MSFGFNSPILDDSDDFAEANQAYVAGLEQARRWQPDARTALVELSAEYPPAHLNAEGRWEIFYWSPGAIKGLKVLLDPQYQFISQNEWGAFYREMARTLGAELLGSHGFNFAPEAGQPGPDGLSFVLRRPAADDVNEFVDIQISTSVMLTPPPRRFTINLVRNAGERPLFGAFGGWEARLGQFLPQPQPDKWWAFQNEAEYEAQLRDALTAVVTYGLPVFEAQN